MRLDADSYPTPDALCRAICLRLSTLVGQPRRVVEPSAGSGAFVRAARAQWPSADLTAVEVRHECELPCLRSGASTFASGDWCAWASRVAEGPWRADLIIGNPPYSLALPHVQAALSVLEPGGHLAFLLRLSFLASAKRADALWSKPGLRYLAPITPRPSFTGGGSDNSEYALFVWRRGWQAMAEILPPLAWTRAGRTAA